jgi:polysaccharide pyruvyl transferase WcaK-like protein
MSVRCEDTPTHLFSKDFDSMQRRDFIAASGLAWIGAMLQASEQKASPKILLRSSWQTVNIGDIAHTPGVLALIEKHIPDAETILWASGDLSEEVAAMEHKRFPKLKIVKGTIRSDGKASSADLGEAIHWCDFLLHGSGPSLVATNDVAAFAKHSKKPYGVYGITQSPDITPLVKDLLTQAQFVFFRDSVSLQAAKDAGVQCPIMEFGPDGAFGCDLRDDEAADTFLSANGLETGKFVCCIPRLRNTPYWKIRGQAMDEAAKAKHARNEAMAEQDISPLRRAIAAIVHDTDMKVLVCPEDKSQMEVGKRWIIDKLPNDVLSKVVWRENYWLTDEALSTYVRSAGLFGLEMHSPIMCIGNGIPAIVCRFAEQTSKGYMWRDIGLNEWLFDFDQPNGSAGLTEAVLDMIRNPTEANARVAKAKQFVQKRQEETMAIVARAI